MPQLILKNDEPIRPAPAAPRPDPSELLPKKLAHARPLFDPAILRRATKDSFVKLNPLTLMKNPVMFVVEVGAAITTIFLIRHIFSGGFSGVGFEFQIALWLWFTVLFANFAEAMAEARGKAQADALRKTKTDSVAKRLLERTDRSKRCRRRKLRAGDIVICEASDIIPGDGEVIDGIATVDESVITGESAPVIRESGGDRSAVTGGTKVLSDHILIRITSNPGETFLDRMIALVEGAERQKTPNEIALNILIAGLTLIFLMAVITLQPFAKYSVDGGGFGRGAERRGAGGAAGVPDSDHDRRPAFGHRHRRNGSRDAAQRAGHERQGGRGVGRRQHSVAR